MTHQPEVSIVIVNYNTRDYTAQCLDSIHDAQPAVSKQIVVVDNASSGDDADWLEEHYPEIKMVRSDENRGIAGGNNLGIRASIGKYILLLNNDTLMRPSTLDQGVRFLEDHPGAGGVGGQLLNPDGSFQSGSFSFPSLWQEFLVVTKIGNLLRPYYPSHPPFNEIREVDWMSSAFMLFRRQALESAGLVDEEFFIYCDETDLQYRLKQKGWEVYYLPSLQTIHFGGKSLNPWRRRKMVYRGYLLFFHKHYGLWRTALLRTVFAGVSGLKLPFWAATYLLPGRRDRSKHELDSNLAIVHMCLQRGVVPPR